MRIHLLSKVIIVTGKQMMEEMTLISPYMDYMENTHERGVGGRKKDRREVRKKERERERERGKEREHAITRDDRNNSF